MGQTVVEKIAELHMVEGPAGRPVRTGDFLTIRPRHVLTHDNTAPVLSKFRSLGADRVSDPRQPVFALDHDIQNTSEENLAKYGKIEEFAREQGVDFYPAGTGIGHQVMIERQYVVPGSFVVASDSHANMYGALSAVGTPVVRTDAAVIWATGTFWWQVPRTIQVVLAGSLPRGAVGKDVILALCGLYNRGEVLNAAIEFTGPGVENLSIEERLSVSNMTTEWGALVGWFPVDYRTVAWLRRRSRSLSALGAAHLGEEEIEKIASAPVQPDPDAVYAGRIRLDLSEVHPHVSGPDTVQVGTPLAEMQARKVAIQKAYLVSCVNSRSEDIAAAAEVLHGKRVADGVEFYVAAASAEVQDEMTKAGAWQSLLDAGAIPLPAGCGPCIGLGAGLLKAGEVGISATNRNFKGRMGSRDAECYLASPAVVAASAAAGYICGADPAENSLPARDYEEFEIPAASGESVEILDGFPERVTGRLVYLPQDNLNTDGIYGKDYTYRDDMTPGMMAEVVFDNYDPEFAPRAREGDLLVGGWNFGTGSSREQAVTALQAAGIGMVVAASFSQTYLRNAFNNGFSCIECPALSVRLGGQFGEAAEPTNIPGDDLTVDFKAGAITYRGETFVFTALGAVPQSLVVAGGVENLARERLRG